MHYELLIAIQKALFRSHFVFAGEQQRVTSAQALQVPATGIRWL